MVKTVIRLKYPPSHCSNENHKMNGSGYFSSGTDVTPVVVNADTASNAAEINERRMGAATKGIAANNGNTVQTTRANVTVCMRLTGRSRPRVATINATPTNAVIRLATPKLRLASNAPVANAYAAGTSMAAANIPMAAPRRKNMVTLAMWRGYLKEFQANTEHLLNHFDLIGHGKNDNSISFFNL